MPFNFKPSHMSISTEIETSITADVTLETFHFEMAIQYIFSRAPPAASQNWIWVGDRLCWKGRYAMRINNGMHPSLSKIHCLCVLPHHRTDITNACVPSQQLVAFIPLFKLMQLVHICWNNSIAYQHLETHTWSGSPHSSQSLLHVGLSCENIVIWTVAADRRWCGEMFSLKCHAFGVFLNYTGCVCIVHVSENVPKLGMFLSLALSCNNAIR